MEVVESSVTSTESSSVKAPVVVSMEMVEACTDASMEVVQVEVSTEAAFVKAVETPTET